MGANFIREGVLATAVVLVKLDGTIFFWSPFPTSSSHHIVSRVTSDFTPCVLLHPTPDSEKDEYHRNDSDGTHESVITFWTKIGVQ